MYVCTDLSHPDPFFWQSSRHFAIFRFSGFGFQVKSIESSVGFTYTFSGPREYISGTQALFLAESFRQLASFRFTGFGFQVNLKYNWVESSMEFTHLQVSGYRFQVDLKHPGLVQKALSLLQVWVFRTWISSQPEI